MEDKRSTKREYVPMTGISTMKDFIEESVIHMDFESEIDAQVEDAMEGMKTVSDQIELYRLQGVITALETNRNIFSVILGLIEEEARNVARHDVTE